MVRAELTSRELRRLDFLRRLLVGLHQHGSGHWNAFLPLSDADMGLQRACLEELYIAKGIQLVAAWVVEFID